MSLDCNEPDSAVFTCVATSQATSGAATDTATPPQAAPQQAAPQLPYPWVQLADQNGAPYYSNPLTGEASWDPPQ